MRWPSSTSDTGLSDVSLQALIDLVFVKDPGLEEAPFAIANRLSQVGRRLPQPLPAAFEPVDPQEIQRWFADEATATWRRIRPDVDKPG